MARNELVSLRGLSQAAATLESLDSGSNPLDTLDSLPTELPCLSELCVRGCRRLHSLAAITPDRCPALAYLDFAESGVTKDALEQHAAKLARVSTLFELDSRGCPCSSLQQNEPVPGTAVAHWLCTLVPQLERIDGSVVPKVPEAKAPAQNPGRTAGQLPDAPRAAAPVSAAQTQRRQCERVTSQVSASVAAAAQDDTIQDQMSDFAMQMGIPVSLLGHATAPVLQQRTTAAGGHGSDEHAAGASIMRNQQPVDAMAMKAAAGARPAAPARDWAAQACAQPNWLLPPSTGTPSSRVPPRKPAAGQQGRPHTPQLGELGALLRFWLQAGKAVGSGAHVPQCPVATGLWGVCVPHPWVQQA